MNTIHTVAVIDIGKTNAKLALVDLIKGEEIAVLKRPNNVSSLPPYPHYETEVLWEFIVAGLTEFQQQRPIDALLVTTHGASAALLQADGTLATPVLDYEYDGPDTLAKDYDQIRPNFRQTGSPRLPLGLNLGAQLHWLFQTRPNLIARTATILTYPQYWAWRLSGVAANEVTSLGCHTDLWCPDKQCLSTLVEQQGWLEMMAPVRKASDHLGPITTALAAKTGIASSVPVLCGIHDSNASLYGHLVTRKPPFTVVSTGTWVISMAIGGKRKTLDPDRDTLMNANAFGDPVPSARFMGGREFDGLMQGHEKACTPQDIDAVLARQVMFSPCFENQSGPFQQQQGVWSEDEKQLRDGERFAAVSMYLALMTATGMNMTGADGTILVEGPFANNSVYLDMLSAALEQAVEAVSGTGTSLGAALLVQPPNHTEVSEAKPIRSINSKMRAYAQIWLNKHH